MEKGYFTWIRWNLYGLLSVLILDVVCPEHLVIQPKDKKTFQDMENSKYFRYFQLDEDRGHLYVGALEHVYRLDVEDISKFTRSDKLPASEDDIGYCLSVAGRTTDFHCSNHIRSILIQEDSIYVCGTGAYAPKEYRLDLSTLAMTEYGTTESGVARCPYNPDHDSTSIYITNGNPSNLNAMYFGTPADPTGKVSLIYRPRMSNQLDKTQTISRDQKWLNNPEFIGSFDVGQYVYFFFRELALETSHCEKQIFSRVARVCKKDKGGSTTLLKTWTTYLKARLNCSIAGEFPFYFDHIRDVQQVDNNRFYALFTTSSTGLFGSAVCEFTLENIETAFDGTFKQQLESDKLWTATPTPDIPSPRPGQCRDDSWNLPDAVSQFIKSRPLMDQAVQTDAPLYYRGNTMYSRMVVDQVNENYNVFFLATDEGTIHKVVQWEDNSVVKTRMLAEWQVTDYDNRQPIRRLQLLHKKLYVGQDYQVVQYSVAQCDSYKLCTGCVQDPYCAWNIIYDKCEDWNPDYQSHQKQAVETTDPVTTCSTQCMVEKDTKETVVRVPGDTVHLPCRSRCASTTSIAWYVHSATSNTYEKIDMSGGSSMFQQQQQRHWMFEGSGVFLTEDNSLVVTNVTREQSLQCQIGEIVLAEHKIKVPACSDAECLWKEEFHKWCTAFDTYTKEFNEWLCLREKCKSDKQCLPTTGPCIGT